MVRSKLNNQKRVRLTGHSRRLVVVICVVLLAAIIGVVAWKHDQLSKDVVRMQATKPTTYGVALGNSARSWNSSQLSTNFEALRKLGVTSVRFDISWSDLQPADADHYDWKPYDAIVASAKAHDLTSLVILDYTPAWARAKDCDSQMCPPADDNQFARYAASVVARYEPMGVKTYEIWNEENSNQFWAPTANATAYQRLLAATSQAMRRQAPDVVILTGGMSPAGDPSEAIAPRQFLKQLYQAGGKDDFDAVAFHPYTSPFVIGQVQAENWTLMDSGTDNLRATMVANGDAKKKIWITEYGAATGGSGAGATTEVTSTAYSHVTPALQSDMARTAIASAKSKPWLGGFYWYTLLDGPANSSDRENFFGLIDSSGKPKPAYYELQKDLRTVNN